MNKDKDAGVDLESNETLLAVNLRNTASDQRTIGAAFINLHERTFLITEFSDNEHLSGLESLIIQQNNSAADSKFKVLINQPSDILREKLQDTVTMCEVEHVFSQDKKEWETKNINLVLDLLLKDSFQFQIEESSMDLALGALNAAINFMKLQNYGEHAQKKFVLKKYTLNQFLRLDVAALKALNVFPQGQTSTDANGPSGQAGSLFGMLNQCKTQVGSRLLKKWLKQPTTNLTELSQRHQIVEYFFANEHIRNDVQQVHLRTFPDLEKLYSKFYRVQAKMRHNASLVDCVKVYNMVHTLESLVYFLGEQSIDEMHSLKSEMLDPLQATLGEFQKLKQMLEECIDINKAKNNDYIIHPNFSPELKEINDQINDQKRRMEKLRHAVEDDLSVKSVNITESALHTYVFECQKAEGDAGMRTSKQTYKIVSIKNKIMSFTCQGLKDICRDINDLQENYQMQQNELVQKVLEIASTYYPLLEQVSMLVSQLDVLCSFAQVSTNQQYVMPEMTSQRNLHLIESRHPLIEIQDPAGCISNSCVMEVGKSNLQIITGPNMGGKSTYIRQVAVSILLAHIGCFVPCSKATIPVIDCIVARVGASDHQLRGISTFMAEMLEASCMLKTATSNSFIIMDELGRGTSTNDGFGLAWAIAEYLATEINCLCLFATHFHEMTDMEKELPNVKNLYVSALAEGEKLTMLYKIKEGVIDRSYGIHVAEMLKFPEEVLQEARRLANQLENFQKA